MPRKNRTRTRKGNLRKKYSRKYRGGGKIFDALWKRATAGVGKFRGWGSTAARRSARAASSMSPSAKNRSSEDEDGPQAAAIARANEQADDAMINTQVPKPNDGTGASPTVEAAAALAAMPEAQAETGARGGKKSRRRRQRSKRGRKSRRYRGGSGCLTC